MAKEGSKIAPSGGEKIKEARLLAAVSSVGISMVVATLLGLVGGWYLDRLLSTQPLFFILGLLIGLVAGFKNIFAMAKRVEKFEKGRGKPQ
jgi:ATP synthase protein I